MGTMTSNEIIGKSVEEYVAPKVDGTVMTEKHSPFDIKNHTKLFEVKSCFNLVKHRLTKAGEQQYESGRLVIYISSHARFKDEAECMGLEPLYYFVLKGRDEHTQWYSMREKVLSWKEVDELLKKGKLSHRYDNADHIKLRLSLIFPQLCLPAPHT
ncbi:Uncharacterised protein [uncultured archaeon]|nr:Uncharacterised protein [uncultured archaeon]